MHALRCACRRLQIVPPCIKNLALTSVPSVKVLQNC